MVIDLHSKIYDPISKEKEHELFLEYFKTKNPKIQEHILRSNMRFVMLVVRKYVKKPDDIPDYFSEGCIGLLHAFNKFTLDRNVRLISYAVFWIKQRIFGKYNDEKIPDDVKILSINGTNESGESVDIIEIEQTTYENQEVSYRKDEIKKLIDTRLAELNSFEESVLRLHHMHELSYENIATSYGMKREKIRSTSNRAIRKIGNDIVGKYVLSKEI